MTKQKEFICPLFGVADICPAVREIKAKAVEVFGWMVVDNKYRFDDQRQNLEPGSKGGYSPELQKAIDFLKELKKE